MCLIPPLPHPPSGADYLLQKTTHTKEVTLKNNGIIVYLVINKKLRTCHYSTFDEVIMVVCITPANMAEIL